MVTVQALQADGQARWLANFFLAARVSRTTL
jgi:hypothetical protein